MNALIGPRGTGKSNKSILLVTKRYSILDDSGASVLKGEQLLRWWINQRRRKFIVIHVEHFHVSDYIWHAQIPKIILVSPTNNAVDFLEDQIQRGITVFK